MKIYFEDGKLVNVNQLPVKPNFVIDAGDGVTESIRMLGMIKESSPNCIIYTNAITAFSNKYAWNDLLNVPEIYIRAGEHMEFARIDTLTLRELREGHNLTKMYVAGEFFSKKEVI